MDALTPAVPEAPVSGAALLESALHLARELDQVRPNLDRQLCLSLITHVPVMLLSDVVSLGQALIADAEALLHRYPALQEPTRQTRTALRQVPQGQVALA